MEETPAVRGIKISLRGSKASWSIIRNIVTDQERIGMLVENYVYECIYIERETEIEIETERENGGDEGKKGISRF